MNQKRVARCLMVAGAMAGMGIVIVFGICLPVIAGEMKAMYPEYPPLYWPGLIGLWCAAALFLLGLWEYFRVCARIGRGQSFCGDNARSLTRIALYMALDGVLCIAAVFAPGLVFHLDIGPVWIILFLCAMACFALGILAWGLGRLVQKAAAIQEENDLTM